MPGACRFEGPKCDIDINECVRGTDDCTANAACINTEAHDQLSGCLLLSATACFVTSNWEPVSFSKRLMLSKSVCSAIYGMLYNGF